MRPRRIGSLIVLGGVVLMTGCASSLKTEQRNQRGQEGVFFEKGGVILTGSALTDGPGTVLATMSGKVPNFRVQRRMGRCPEITLRNSVSFQSVDVNPHVYVDGTLTTDTCILETLQSGDVERVEVYPQGFTTRPGYGTHANGLILVFMRSG